MQLGDDGGACVCAFQCNTDKGVQRSMTLAPSKCRMPQSTCPQNTTSSCCCCCCCCSSCCCCCCCRFAIFVGTFCSSLLKRRIIIIKNQQRCRCCCCCGSCCRCRPFSHWVLDEQPQSPASEFCYCRQTALGFGFSTGFSQFDFGFAFEVWVLSLTLGSTATTTAATTTAAATAARSVAARLGH